MKGLFGKTICCFNKSHGIEFGLFGRLMENTLYAADALSWRWV